MVCCSEGHKTPAEVVAAMGTSATHLSNADLMSWDIYIFIYTSKHINLYIDLFINKYIYMPSGYLTWPWYRWPIEIDGLPIKNGGSFHGYVSHNQRVYIYSK